MRNFVMALAVMSLVMVGCSCNKCAPKKAKAPACRTCKAGKITKVRNCGAKCDDCQMQALSFCSECYDNTNFSRAELVTSMPLGQKKVVMVEREVAPAAAAKPAVAPAPAPAKPAVVAPVAPAPAAK